MHKIIVFLGPSLEQSAAEKILPAEYRPPAKRGDLIAAARDGATIIGLIDGVFHQESAVAHREDTHRHATRDKGNRGIEHGCAQGRRDGHPRDGGHR